MRCSPDFAASWLALAGVYIVAGRPDAGIAEARRLQKELPTRAAGYALEGNLLMRQKKPLDAAKAYREALAREPLPILAVSLYSALQAAGRKDQAAAMAQQWQKEHPKDVVLLTLQGQQALLAKDYKTAVDALARGARGRARQRRDAQQSRVGAERAGRPEGAASMPSGPPVSRRTRPSVMDTQGWILVAQGKTARGVELLRMASGLSPQDADIRLHFAKALLKSGRQGRARRRELEAVAVLTQASPARAEAQQMLKEL